MSAYALTQEYRLRECVKAVQDVIRSTNTDKDCRTPIFGFAATSILTLTFVILQDNVERKARAMGVWEVISGLRKLKHKEPMDPARILIDNKGVTVLEAVADTDPSALSAGQLQARASGIALGASHGVVLLLRVKPDGKAEMDATAWARGARLAADAAWGRAR